MAFDVETSTYYVNRDEKFKEEKPYELQYQPPGDFPATNVTWSKHENIRVTDVRGSERDFDIESHGFQICQMRTSLMDDEFDVPEKVETTFLAEVASCVKDSLQADRVLIFDYAVRKSTADFPLSTGESLPYQTPATIVHIDTTQAWTARMNDLYENTMDGIEGNIRYQYVNFWKPLKGPVKRWPLMLCDWSTYDTSNDVVSRDLVYTDGDIETTLGYYNPGHRYYYLSNQTTDEAWLMVQSDSVKGKGVLHTAFPSPLTESSDQQRESIEVRCMVYYYVKNASNE